jgi:hypothetical protein
MNKKNRTSYRQPEPPRRFPGVWLGIGLALLLIVAGAVLLWPRSSVDPNFVPEVSGAPKLAVDQTLVDAGDVQFETPVQAAFRLRNVGGKPLQILGQPQVELVEGC